LSDNPRFLFSFYGKSLELKERLFVEVSPFNDGNPVNFLIVV
jgi:hypothetical protein